MTILGFIPKSSSRIWYCNFINVGEKEVEKIEKSWLITTNSEAIIKKLESLMKSGYNRVYIHSASPHEKKFLDLLGRDVLPWMREYYDTLVNPITLVSD